MHCVEIAFVSYIKRVHAHHGFEPDPWRLARRLGLDVQRGEQDALLGRVITLHPDTHANRRRSASAVRHEITHHLLKLSGTEDQVLHLRNSYEAGLPTLEKLAYHGSLVLHIPDAVLGTAHDQHGNTPAALLHIAELSGVELSAAIERWVYAEVGAQRAAWVTRGGLVVHAASANYWLPFWHYAEVQDVLEEVPNALLLPLDGRQTLGVVSW